MADGVEKVIEDLWRRLERNYVPDVADYLMTSTFVLSGLRLDRKLAVKLFRRYRAVEESTTYQYILERGAIAEVRKLLLRRGTSKFGSPSKKVRAVVQELEDLPRLERMVDCAIDTAKSWNDVMETP